jgi:hypothetical protein
MRDHDVAPAAIGACATGPRRSHVRTLGRWGTVARVLGGSALIILATAVWQADWLDLVIGLVALPAVATSLTSLRNRSAPPLRLGPAGHLVTLAHVAITASVLGGEAAALFYGSMALIAGVLGNGGWEITVLANWLRGRDDRVGCPIFGPFDVLDRQLATRRDGAR